MRGLGAYTPVYDLDGAECAATSGLGHFGKGCLCGGRCASCKVKALRGLGMYTASAPIVREWGRYAPIQGLSGCGRKSGTGFLDALFGLFGLGTDASFPTVQETYANGSGSWPTFTVRRFPVVAGGKSYYDSLSLITWQFGRPASEVLMLWNINQSRFGWTNPNVIQSGQALYLPPNWPPAPVRSDAPDSSWNAQATSVLKAAGMATPWSPPVRPPKPTPPPAPVPPVMPDPPKPPNVPFSQASMLSGSGPLIGGVLLLAGAFMAYRSYKAKKKA